MSDSEPEWGVIPAHVFTEAQVNGEATCDVPGWGQVTIMPRGVMSVEDMRRLVAGEDVPPTFDIDIDDGGRILVKVNPVTR